MVDIWRRHAGVKTNVGVLMRIWFLTSVLIASCSKSDSPPKAEPVDGIRLAYEQAQDRALELSDAGRIVSRKPDGSLEHTGDSAIMSGLAMAFFDCDRGGKIEDILLADIKETGGEVTRHPLERHRASSLDQALGIWAGAARRLDCEGAKAKWAEAGSLKPQGASTAPFDYVRQLLRHRLGLIDKPSDFERLVLERIAADWARLVVEREEACYRVHLAYRALRTVEVLGEEISAAGKGSFCNATKGSGLANVEHWCGRESLTAFIASFKPNEWEYKHQRCPWESPDGNGDTTPGLDLVEALYETYDL